MKLEFSRLIFEDTQIRNFIKIRPVGVQLFSHEEANNRFPQFLPTRL